MRQFKKMPPKSNIARNVKKAIQKVDHKNKVFTHIPAQASPHNFQLIKILFDVMAIQTAMDITDCVDMV